MPYTAWSVTAGETPSAAKWNILGANDASFADGTGLNSVPINKGSIPYKFSAYRNGALTGASGANVIVFDTKEYDTGTNYSTVDGKFTAPITGLYDFRAAINSAVNNGGWSSIALHKNGLAAKLGSGFIGYVPGGPQTMSVHVSADIQLTAGDYVQVVWTTNGVPIYAGQAGVWFQGKIAGIS